MTAHGGTNPNASCSRLVSRMVISSALAPARLSLAPCSPPSRTLRAASRWPAAILDPSCAQRLRELRPGRRNGSQPNRETPDQPRDWLSLPTPNSEEAILFIGRPLFGSARHALGQELLQEPDDYRSDFGCQPFAFGFHRRPVKEVRLVIRLTRRHRFRSPACCTTQRIEVRGRSWREDPAMRPTAAPALLRAASWPH